MRAYVRLYRKGSLVVGRWSLAIGRWSLVVGRWPLAIGLCLLAVLLSACRTTKFVPDGQYLLNKAKVEIEDTKDVPASDIRSYLRQKQNSEIFGFWKLQLHVYNTAPSDTTTKTNKWLANNAHKMGEAPEIYDETLTEVSMRQIRLAMQNRGYFNAEVDTTKQVHGKDGKKLDLTYRVTAHEPYTISEYTTLIEHGEVDSIAKQYLLCKVHEGDQYNTSTLDDERQRITSTMRNRGYYYYDKSLLAFAADSSNGNHTVRLQLHETHYRGIIPDSIMDKVYVKQRIRRVLFHVDYDMNRLPDDLILHEDSDQEGYVYSYVGMPLLRNKVLRRKCLIRPGEMFSERRLERTYANMNALGPVKYVDIAFQAVDSGLMDCHVTISRSKIHSVSAEVEGTFSAGDWGVAAGVGYMNKNLFRGAELFTLNGRGSYEWRQNGGRAIEARVDAGLQFPNSLKINIGYNYQQRPEEYTRTLASAGLSYEVPHKPRSRWTHRFNLVDINYIYLPWISDQFYNDFIKKSSVLRASYEDLFILDWSYSGTYSSHSDRHPYRSYLDFRYSVETAGNFLYGLAKLCKLSQNENGSYMLWNIPFAQYAKGDAAITYHQIFTPKHQLVYHAALGIVVPYLNADIVPFEKRYFAGGSNSVRGWQARTLGPGTFRGDGNTMVYDLQAGDIRLDLNLEYRWKVWKYLELAAFTDAGNIWTIRDYAQQPGGVFKWDKFYEQIAWSYGVGARIDLSLFIFRIDFGVKLYDPSLISAGTQWRTAANGLNWKDDMTFHFAIGHPF